MEEVVEIDSSGVELGRWLGRREAFGLIAGRCSAAEIESLRRIRDDRLYLKLNPTWEEFCSRQLHVIKRTVNREIGYLERFGPAFFTLRQLARVSVREYTEIAACITEEGVHLEGHVVALLPENSEALAGAVETLLKEKEPPAAAPAGFQSVLGRLRTANQGLGSYQGDLDAAQLHALARELAEILSAAAALGVTLRAR